MLESLGRYGEALAEIDAMLPIRTEVSGDRHPGTLTTRSLRIGVELQIRLMFDAVEKGFARRAER